MDIIKPSNLSKRFTFKKNSRVSKIIGDFFTRNDESKKGKLALDNINLTIQENKIFGIVGLNGSGKTTLLKIIAGIMEPTSGLCEVQGKAVCCFGLPDFYSDLLLRDNLYVYGAFLGIPRSRLNEFFSSRTELGYIRPFLDCALYSCSPGIISRATFALTTLSEADIMLFDEVPMSTDINFQRLSITLLNNLKKAGKTLVISSHNPYFLEQVCDQAILLEEGKIVKSGIAKEVFEDYKNRYR